MIDITLTEYFVYGLCDPITCEVFYIGKGKGNRAEQHLVEKEKSGQGNRDKLKKIKDILGSKGKIKIIYYITNINEEAAYFLEEILIERIGRITYGGTLTNILDGNTSENYKLSINGLYEIKNERNNIDFVINKYPELKDIIELVPRTTKEDEFEVKFKSWLKRQELLKIQEQERNYVIDTLQSLDSNIFIDLGAKKIFCGNSFSGKSIYFECKYGFCQISLGDEEKLKRKSWYDASVFIRDNEKIVYDIHYIPKEEITKKLRYYMNIIECGSNVYFKEVGPTPIIKPSKKKLKKVLPNPSPIFESYPIAKKNEIIITAPFDITNVKIKKPGLKMPSLFTQDYHNSAIVEINIESLPMGTYVLEVRSGNDISIENLFDPIYSIFMVII